MFSSQGFKSPGELVPMAVRVHPFPSRTRQLSSSAPTILGWKRPGKIGRRQHRRREERITEVIRSSSLCMAGWEGSCVVDGFFLTYPQQEGCVEHHRHTLCAMCTGQHGTVAVSGEMYDEGMGDLMPHGEYRLLYPPPDGGPWHHSWARVPYPKAAQ